MQLFEKGRQCCREVQNKMRVPVVTLNYSDKSFILYTQTFSQNSNLVVRLLTVVGSSYLTVSQSICVLECETCEVDINNIECVFTDR